MTTENEIKRIEADWATNVIVPADGVLAGIVPTFHSSSNVPSGWGSALVGTGVPPK